MHKLWAGPLWQHGKASTSNLKYLRVLRSSPADRHQNGVRVRSWWGGGCAASYSHGSSLALSTTWTLEFIKPTADNRSLQRTCGDRPSRKNINITHMNIKWGHITWEISNVKSSVFPGRALDEPSHTRLTSRLDRSPWEWPYTGWTKLAERDTTSFKMFKASFQCTVYGTITPSTPVARCAYYAIIKRQSEVPIYFYLPEQTSQ